MNGQYVAIDRYADIGALAPAESLLLLPDPRDSSSSSSSSDLSDYEPDMCNPAADNYPFGCPVVPYQGPMSEVGAPGPDLQALDAAPRWLAAVRDVTVGLVASAVIALALAAVLLHRGAAAAGAPAAAAPTAASSFLAAPPQPTTAEDDTAGAPSALAVLDLTLHKDQVVATARGSPRRSLALALSLGVPGLPGSCASHRRAATS